MQLARTLSPCLLAPLLWIASGPDDVRAQCAPDTLRGTFSNPMAGVNMGDDVAIFGDRAVVGAFEEDVDGVIRTGSAYVLDATTGALVTRLVNPSPTDNDEFGSAVAISEVGVVAGAPREDPDDLTNAGIVYVFDPETGVLRTTIFNPEPAEAEFFGFEVAISGDRVLVGSPYDDGVEVNFGAAYLFDAASGDLLANFESPAPPTRRYFGQKIGIAGDRVVVSDTDAAYLYGATSGVLVATLNNPTSDTSDNFGDSVAISEDWVVVGAPWADPGGLASAGIAYVFDATSGALSRTLGQPSPRAGADFAYAVGISGHRVLVGAPDADPVEGDVAGMAFVFDARTGGLLVTLPNPSPNGAEGFGRGVAIDGNRAIVGDPNDNASGAGQSGSVFLYDCEAPAPLCAPIGLRSRLYDPEPNPGGRFGGSVSVSGNQAVVGVPGHDENGKDFVGKACIFDPRTGSLLRELPNPEPSAGDSFGESVHVSGSLVVVGAWGHYPNGIPNSGGAYVFDSTTGNRLATLVHPQLEAGAQFGSSVAISGTLVIVGAPFDDGSLVSDTGAAYVFEASTGELVTSIPSPSVGRDDFGSAVAIDGDLVVVGAPLADSVELDTGLAWVFDALTGERLAILQNPVPDRGANFGASVAIDGDLVVVGAWRDDASGLTDSGSVHVFEARTGAFVATILDPDPVAFGQFGLSVALDGNEVLVGSPGAERALLFHASTGDFLADLGLGESVDFAYGVSVALDGTTAVVGAWEDDPGGLTDAGAAFVFGCFPPGSTPTPSPTPTVSPTRSPSPTPSPSPSPTRTPSPSPSPSRSPTASPTQSASPTLSPSPTASPSASPSATPSPSPSASPTPSPSETPSPSPSATPSSSPSASPSPSATPSPSPSVSASPSPSPGSTPSPSPTVSPTPPPTLSNLSTRGFVDAGAGAMIGGFIVSGSDSRRVLISGIGPDLANFGVSGVLGNPALALFQGQTALFSNDDWGLAANSDSITSSGFAPSHPLEAAILAELDPGEYTAILYGVAPEGSPDSERRGVGLVQAFDLGPRADGDPISARLSNLSTRLGVGTGDQVMIAGFTVAGSEAGEPKRLLVRGLGPTLGGPPFAVEGAMTDPELLLYGPGESGIVQLASNADWIRSPEASAIAATGKAPPDPREPAILAALRPGAYTAIVSGAGGTAGVALIEVYEVE